MEQWADIRHRVLIEGTSRRQIQRETGLHWKTLKKVLENSAPPGYRQGQPRDGQELPPLVYMKWNPKLHENLGRNAKSGTTITRKRSGEKNGRSLAGRPDPGVGGLSSGSPVSMGGAGQGLQGGGVSDGSSATGDAGDARNVLPRGIEQEVADLGKLNDYQLQALGLTRAEVDSAIKVYSDPSSANYSISTSAEIDRVNTALDGMNRGPDSRLDVYIRAKWVFGKLLDEN